MILAFARFILLARQRFTGSLHFDNVSWVSVINEIVKITNKQVKNFQNIETVTIITVKYQSSKTRLHTAVLLCFLILRY